MINEIFYKSTKKEGQLSHESDRIQAHNHTMLSPLHKTVRPSYVFRRVEAEKKVGEGIAALPLKPVHNTVLVSSLPKPCASYDCTLTHDPVPYPL